MANNAIVTSPIADRMNGQTFKTKSHVTPAARETLATTLVVVALPFVFAQFLTK